MGKEELEGFDQFWSAYPKRKGDNPKKPARTSFDKAIRSGASASDIVAGAKAYAMHKDTRIGTEFVPMAVTWLNQNRWEGYAPETVHARSEKPGFYVSFSSEEMEAWTRYEMATRKSHPRDKNGGWRFPTRWPPEVAA